MSQLCPVHIQWHLKAQILKVTIALESHTHQNIWTSSLIHTTMVSKQVWALRYLCDVTKMQLLSFYSWRNSWPRELNRSDTINQISFQIKSTIQLIFQSLLFLWYGLLCVVPDMSRPCPKWMNEWMNEVNIAYQIYISTLTIGWWSAKNVHFCWWVQTEHHLT